MSKIYVLKRAGSSEILASDKKKLIVEELMSKAYPHIEPSQLVVEEMDYTQFMLLQLPKEFHSVLSSMAYDRGHSAGEEECEAILRELINDLLPAIEAYRLSILAQ